MAEQVRRLFDLPWEMLNTEIEHVDGTIRQLDQITMSVKNWAVITWTGSVGVALKEANLHRFVWITAIVPVVFWITDSSFRRIQRSFIYRLQDISRFLESPEFREAAEKGAPLSFPLLVMRVKNRKFKNTLLGVMLLRSVGLFYLGLAACSIFVWLGIRG
jgi:hypothetical protein